MPTRIITTRIDRPFSSEPWKGAKAVFEFVSGTYDASRQIPGFTRVVKANDAGNLQVELETTTDKEGDCYWLCTLPDGVTFPFDVPATGSGNLTLSLLRQSGEVAPSTPSHNLILAYVDDAIAGIGSGVGYPTAREILDPVHSPTFQLANIPVLPHLSALHINGQKQFYGSDYVINSSILQWFGYALQSDWAIEFTYYRSN